MNDNQLEKCFKTFDDLYSLYSDRISKVKIIDDITKDFLKENIIETEEKIKSKKEKIIQITKEEYKDKSYYINDSYFNASVYLCKLRLTYELELIDIYKKALEGNDINTDLPKINKKIQLGIIEKIIKH